MEPTGPACSAGRVENEQRQERRALGQTCDVDMLILHVRAVPIGNRLEPPGAKLALYSR